MSLPIILILTIFSLSCGTSNKESDQEKSKRLKLEFIENRIDEYDAKIDSTKKVGGDSGNLATLSQMVNFLQQEYDSVKAEK